MSAFASHIAHDSSQVRLPIALDPRQPFLHDHQPGGHPLFGTVMAVEAMAGAALALGPAGLRVHRIETVQNFSPYILHDGAAAPLEAAATLVDRSADGLTADATLSSRGDGGEPIVHCRARFVLDAAMLPRGPAAPPTAHAAPSITAADVYALYFHGPAFRVIESARWDEPRLEGRWNARLPTLFDPPRATAASPRLIEFAMQCAGLYEVAKNRRMMIPSVIGRIVRYEGIDEAEQDPLLAVIDGSNSEADPGRGIDMAVRDATGRALLKVCGYRTVTLPFAMNPGAIECLHRSMVP